MPTTETPAEDLLPSNEQKPGKPGSADASRRKVGGMTWLADRETGSAEAPTRETESAEAPTETEPVEQEDAAAEPEAAAGEAEAGEAEVRQAEVRQAETDDAEADVEVEVEAQSGAEAEPEPVDADGSADEAEGTVARRRDPVRTAAVALVTVAAIVCAWAGWTWYSAAHDSSVHYSKLRDKVLASALQEVQNLNSLDYRTFDQSMKIWDASATGKLLQTFVANRSSFQQKVSAAKMVSTAKVLEGALTQLDDRAGKAEVIVAVQITVTPSSGQPSVKLSREIGELTKTRSGWKLSDFGQAPEGTSGS